MTVADSAEHRPSRHWQAEQQRRLDDDVLAAKGTTYIDLFPDEERRQKILRGRLKALGRAGINEP